MQQKLKYKYSDKHKYKYNFKQIHQNEEEKKYKCGDLVAFPVATTTQNAAKRSTNAITVEGRKEQYALYTENWI